MAANTFGAHVNIVMGQSPPGDLCTAEPLGLPLLNGPTEFGRHHPTPVQYTTESRKRAVPGDILFCVRGSTTGRMNWADREYAIGRGIAAIRHKTNPKLQPLVRAIIESILPGLLSQATGSTFRNVSAGQLAGVRWPEIEGGDEEAIASILGALDEKIDLNWKSADALENIFRSTFKSWFLDYDPIRKKAAGKSSSGIPKEVFGLLPDKIVNSEDGPIPKGWNTLPISHFADIHRSMVSPESSPDEVFQHFSIPAFDEMRIPTIEVGRGIKSNKFLVPPRAILLSKLNPRLPRVWLAAPRGDRRAISSTEFLVVVPRSGCSSEWLFGLLTSDAFSKKFTSLVTGTSNSHQRVRPDDFLGMPVVGGTDSLRDLFSRLMSPLLERVQIAIDEATALAGLRNAMISRLLTGQLRLREDAIKGASIV